MWIEINAWRRYESKCRRSPSARKVWIEIARSAYSFAQLLSPSARKVWIEMMKSNKNIEVNIKSPSARKVWIEILRSQGWSSCAKSPSARKVWIEIYPHYLGDNAKGCHLPRGRCGLKSIVKSEHFALILVAFREEGVDWNANFVGRWVLALVTFREEGVDWNLTHMPQCLTDM